jgi:hypothetical protein
MVNDPFIRDLILALLIVGGLIAGIYLVVLGIHVLLVIGFLIPGWLILLVLAYMIFRRRKKVEITLAPYLLF